MAPQVFIDHHLPILIRIKNLNSATVDKAAVKQLANEVAIASLLMLMSLHQVQKAVNTHCLQCSQKMKSIQESNAVLKVYSKWKQTLTPSISFQVNSMLKQPNLQPPVNLMKNQQNYLSFPTCSKQMKTGEFKSK